MPLKEVLTSLPRFEDLSVAWWRIGDSERVGEPGGLASEAAAEISARMRVAVLEEGRRERAKGVQLGRVGYSLYRADDSYLVDTILGLCAYRDFERHNGRKRKKAGRRRTPIGISGEGTPQIPAFHLPLLVHCKHLIAAEEAERQADRRDHDPAPIRNASPSPLGLGVRSKPRGGGSRGGQKP